MIFLNPAWLIALAAAGVPILIHLFGRRRPRLVRFSTLMFLREMEKRQFKRLKIRQWLLLALRTLAILLLAAGFARPALSGSIPGMTDRTESEMVVILDDSPSMSYSGLDGVRMDWARLVVEDLESLAEPRDQLSVIRLSQPSIIEPAKQFFQEPAQVAATAGEVQSALKSAAQALTVGGNANRELYIISDLAGPAWSNIQAVSWPDRTKLFFLVPPGSVSEENVAVDSIAVASELVRIGKELTVWAQVTNTGSQEVTDRQISSWIDGRRTQALAISLPPGSSRMVRFTASVRRAGFLEIAVSAEDDQLRFDNRRYAVLKVPDHTNVVVICEDSWQRRVIGSALESGGEKGFEVLLRSPNAVAAQELELADVIVLSDVADGMDQSRKQWLKQALERGASAIVFMGPSVDLQSYNREILSWVSSSRAINITDSRSSALGDTAGYYVFQKKVRENSLLSGLVEGEAQFSPAVAAYVRMSATQGVVDARYTNGDPAIIVDHGTSGRGVIITTGLDRRWSDLALTGLFVPLLHRAVEAVTQNADFGEGYIAGQTVERSLEGGSAQYLEIEKPDGSRSTISRSVSRLGASVSLGTLDMVGIWRLWSGTTQIDGFSVNPDPLESRLSPNSPKFIAGRMGARLWQEIGGSIPDTVLESRFGTELTWLFIFTALACLVGELWLERSRPPKVGSQGASSRPSP